MEIETHPVQTPGHRGEQGDERTKEGAMTCSRCGNTYAFYDWSKTHKKCCHCGKIVAMQGRREVRSEDEHL